MVSFTTISPAVAIVIGLLSRTISAAPNPVALPVPASASAVASICSVDAVYLALAAPVLASTASRFCSSYIRSTVSATTTSFRPVTATATATVTATTVIKKRAVSVNLSAIAPASLLSSACSCLLVNSPPPPTTIYPFTNTVTTTVTTVTKTQSVTETCASAAFTSLISNGDFSQDGTDWTIVTDAAYGCDQGEDKYCFNPTGYPTGYSGLLYIAFNNPDPVGLNLSQSLTICAGTKYSLSATFKSLFCGFPFGFYVDGQMLIDGSSQACNEGVYPSLDEGPYHTVSTTFIAQSNAAVFSIQMANPYTLTDKAYVKSVVIVPA